MSTEMSLQRHGEIDDYNGEAGRLWGLHAGVGSELGLLLFFHSRLGVRTVQSFYFTVSNYVVSCIWVPHRIGQVDAGY